MWWLKYNACAVPLSNITNLHPTRRLFMRPCHVLPVLDLVHYMRE